MSTPDGRYHLVFNGEIYNYLELRSELERHGHVFVSQTDTEVLLKACLQWGVNALHRLVGMFAFALLDTTASTVLLARDFFGIKPLFFARWRKGWAFCSEIPPLLDLPGIRRVPSPQKVFDYLRFGLTDHDSQSMFADIAQLPPAHYALVSLDDPEHVQIARYWDIRSEPQDVSFNEAARTIGDLFIDSVRLHLRSDVPVGVALSGGIDSTSILCCMREIAGKNLDLRTFSFVAGGSTVDEENWIDAAAQYAGAECHKTRPLPEDLISDLPRIILRQGEPAASTSFYAQYRVFQLAAEHGVKVMLDGQGADELLAGYDFYRPARLASLIRQPRWQEALRFTRTASRYTNSRGLLLSAAEHIVPMFLRNHMRSLSGRSLMPAWLNSTWFTDRGVVPVSPRTVGAHDALHRELYETVVRTSLPMLLRYEDRNSMAHSIESRVPFLTPQLAKYCLSMPEEFLIDERGTTKSVFRAAMRGLVPQSVLERKDKIGFATPQDDWIGKLRPWIGLLLNSTVQVIVPPLNARRLLEAYDNTRCGHTASFLWRAANLVQWTKQFDVSF